MITMIRVAAIEYIGRNREVPDDIQSLRSLPGYASMRSADAWGRPIIFRVMEGKLIIRSLGRDGQLGGVLEDRDLQQVIPLHNPDGNLGSKRDLQRMFYDHE